jgi:hypothetical protein
MLTPLEPADLKQSFHRLAYDLMFQITGPADETPGP